MPSKYERKRKRDLDADTTKTFDGEKAKEEERKRRHRSKSRSRSPKKSKKNKRDEEDKGGDKNEESLSIEETNKLRAKLGLAPLELDDNSNKEPVEKEDGSGEKVFTEYGIEIVHKPSQNWSEDKRQKELKEKLETKKKQREVYGKVLKAKRGLAEDSEEEDGGGNTAKWVEKNRRMEEEMRKAQEKAKQLDEMDEAFGIGGMVQQAEQQKRGQRTKKKNEALTSGLVVGHSVTDFSEGRETILVLQDKSILDDEDDEVLINPNMIENERHKLNVERRKKTATHYQNLEEEVDEFGQVKKPEILSKYDQGLDGDAKKRETFRLDTTGQYDLDRETQEAEAKHRLMMINKKFESLDATKYTLANEFYTQEEIIQFRRPKKSKEGGKNIRKKKKKGDLLKADDLEPLEPMEETPEEKKAKEAKLAARRAAANGQLEGTAKFKETLKETKSKAEEEIEEGELADEIGGKDSVKKGRVKSKEENQEEKSPLPAELGGKEKWKKPKANVNVKMLESLAEKMKKKHREADEDEESDEEEEEFPHATNVVPIRIDDEAEDELNAMLAKARRLKQAEINDNGRRMPTIKEEESSEEDDEEGMAMFGRKETAIIFDATSEKYKSIGGGGYGAGGKEVKMEEGEQMEQDEEMDEETMLELLNKEVKKRKSKKRNSSKDNNESDDEDERMDEDRPQSSQSESSSDMPGSSYTNILGEEKDVTKGVGAMLKLAGEKGYLESGNRRRVGEGSLKHLESKRYSKVEQGRLDIEDKTMRKLERMGTTGTGPTRPFPEKPDYKPKIEITYSDKSGRVLEPKEAFRALSWKFHGKGPGKKQAEKHTMKVVKREKMKKMNSQDTPLGTLNKQLKKQEQLQAPYLVLTGRADAAPLQKE